MRLKHLLLASAVTAIAADAQTFREGYVDWGAGSQQFATTIANWTPGTTMTDDDNFFISRQKPHHHFRNTATQVRPELDASNDKHLIAWLPINEPSSNALPGGTFDSECFTMWAYVTHWGNWTAAVGRIPAAFADVAHKNGVAVSGVASIPNASLNVSSMSGWKNALRAYGTMDVDKVAAYFRYHGINGMGYNSEFSSGSTVCPGLRTLHANLVKKLKPVDPLCENIWYDGTNDNGTISFDRGLASHNDDTFGDADNVRTSLFFNYNWNKASLLSASVDYARNTSHRDPLDLYAGVNMQGNEPASNNWPLLKDYPISIGLWGAHSNNMFWESRGEKGSAPDVKQTTYIQRIERWFTGGTRNPAACPDFIVSNKYNAENYKFHGMSSMMSARSALSWDLGEEPFISYFNIGNGRYFNYAGERQHNREWYNLSAQDYQPTWHYWFASRLLGRTAADVPATGLDATVTWDDAYMGGSSLRIYGSTDNEYLHLFKTRYTLRRGDVITLRYKLRNGHAHANLVLTAEGAEAQPVDEAKLCVIDQNVEDDERVWQTRSFTVGDNLDGKDLALVALHFSNASDMDLLLGEFSIVRGTAPTPAQPVIASATTLHCSKEGIDAKIIWNMPNDKAPGEPCYNTDVNTGFFKVYAQQQDHDPVLMGISTPWADLIYSVPVDVTADNISVRYGVSAVSTDHKSESAIAWSDYETVADYDYCDDISIDKTTIKPGEDFSIGYIDPKHEAASWSITDADGRVVYSGEGHDITVDEGLGAIGSYDLHVEGYVSTPEGRVSQSRTFGSFVQISGESVGALPRITSFTANGHEDGEEVCVELLEDVLLQYTGRPADGTASQGVDLREERFGAQCSDLELVGTQSYSVAFWLKLDELAVGETQLFSVANKRDTWPKTDWGWVWVNLLDDGSIGSFTFRGDNIKFTDESGSHNDELQYRFADTKMPVGNWAHVGFVFDYDAAGNFRCDFYINGKRQNVTSWTRRSAAGVVHTDQPGYEPNVYRITNGQVLAIGGPAHGRSGIKGAIDNVIVWQGAVDATTIKAAMGDIHPDALAGNVTAFWDLETAAATDGTFTSAGNKHIAAGLHSYEAVGGEGQGAFHWLPAVYTSGCPFVAGTAFPVVTVPSWSYTKAILTEPTPGNDRSGEAHIAWQRGGQRDVTLTLTNSHGSDSRTISCIDVSYPEGIADVTRDGSDDNGRIRVVNIDGEEALLALSAPGHYTVSVLNAAGQRIGSRTAHIDSPRHMSVRLGQPGAYIVSVTRDGQRLSSIKLIAR